MAGGALGGGVGVVSGWSAGRWSGPLFEWKRGCRAYVGLTVEPETGTRLIAVIWEFIGDGLVPGVGHEV